MLNNQCKYHSTEYKCLPILGKRHLPRTTFSAKVSDKNQETFPKWEIIINVRLYNKKIATIEYGSYYEYRFELSVSQ